jgi:hypothetical protein
MSSNRLISLEERMDAQLQSFGAMPEDYYSPGYPVVNEKYRSDLRKKRAGAVVGAGALGLAGAAAMSNPKIREGAKSAAQMGLRKTAMGTDMLGNKLAKIATAPGAGASRMGRLAGKGSSGMVSAGRLLRKTANFSRAEADAVIELAQRVAMIELDAHEFASDPERQRGKVGMYMTGGSVGLYDQKQYRKSGLAYRKRDALKDGMKGTAANYGAAAATGAGVGLGALGLGALAAKGKLPKGMLRKVGVKAGQAMKKGSPKLLLGTGLAATLAGSAAHIKVQHGSAEKRRKKLLLERLNQGGEA